jgi:hypothetical protein
MMRKISAVLCAVTIVITAMISTAFAENNLKIGDYIKLGSYNQQPILWRYVGDDENGKLFVSKDIICFKSYDAAGKESDQKDRTTYGSNIWSESTIRSWLNSTQVKVDFAYGNTPDKENVWNGYNPYDKAPGFLTNFNNDEINAIKEVTLKTKLNDADSALADGEYNSVSYDYSFAKSTELQKYQSSVDRVFLLDENQLEMTISNLSDDFFKKGETVIDSGAYQTLDTNLKDFYLLRSPNTYEKATDKICAVTTADDECHFDTSMEAYMSSGIRPAIYLNDNAEFIAGIGTKADPYIISDKIVDNSMLSSDSAKNTLTVTNDNNNIRLFLDGTEMIFQDGKPFIDDNGRTQIPLRAVAENLNYNVDYNDSNGEVTIEDNSNKISLKVNSNILKCNDKIIEMDTTSKIFNDRTYIPIRFAAEALGFEVEYTENVTGWTINENGEITVTTNSGSID